MSISGRAFNHEETEATGMVASDLNSVRNNSMKIFIPSLPFPLSGSEQKFGHFPLWTDKKVLIICIYRGRTEIIKIHTKNSSLPTLLTSTGTHMIRNNLKIRKNVWLVFPPVFFFAKTVCHTVELRAGVSRPGCEDWLCSETLSFWTRHGSFILLI